MKNKLFTAFLAGLLGMISLNAMDTAPESGMRIGTFSDSNAAARRQARTQIKPDFVLERTAEKFERYNLSLKHNIFKGLSSEKHALCASDCFERFIKEGDEQKVAATLQKYPRFAQSHPLAKSLVAIATNTSDTLDFDQKQNPGTSYLEAMNIALSFASDGNNQKFIDSHFIEYQTLWSPTNSSSSSSLEDWSNSDDF